MVVVTTAWLVARFGAHSLHGCARPPAPVGPQASASVSRATVAVTHGPAPALFGRASPGPRAAPPPRKGPSTPNIKQAHTPQNQYTPPQPAHPPHPPSPPHTPNHKRPNKPQTPPPTPPPPRATRRCLCRAEAFHAPRPLSPKSEWWSSHGVGCCGMAAHSLTGAPLLPHVGPPMPIASRDKGERWSTLASTWPVRGAGPLQQARGHRP